MRDYDAWRKVEEERLQSSGAQEGKRLAQKTFKNTGIPSNRDSLEQGYKCVGDTIKGLKDKLSRM